ncbi:helix-turn-helix domain-containing protein [Hymenobacter rubripertinctus]|uniref:XRE family transcriptional regulator n=1 Tax=Hymenobacter rubripertinctus TaxID=2029981 RepID=A0A418R963_9BACT|nr:helix-turn-helix transcriptional regulator [Hymenobacter rubripertinctus]RIY13831.1 XRE family transcriptional regulator [Hymenobacter rubripertinctus]
MSASAPSLVARVRAWFGLTQAELALYLGISPSLVRDLETNRRPLTPAVRAALLPLLLQLPPPQVPADPGPGAALPPPAPAPDAADLDFRRRECRHRAERLLAQADALVARAHVAARWAAALPALLPPDPDTAAPDALPAASPAAQALAAALAQAADAFDPTRAPDHARWLRGWLTFRARPLPAADVTGCLRLRAQAAGLLAEAAALDAALLPAVEN